MVTYEEYTNNFGQVFIKKIEDNFITFIPKDNSNSDYQAYLNKDTLASELSNPSTPQAGE